MLKLGAKVKRKSRVPFPIVSENGGVVTLVNGLKVYTYEQECPDLDSYSNSEINSVYNDLAFSLKELSEGDWLKFHRFYDQQRTIISSNVEVESFGRRKASPLSSPTYSNFLSERPISDIEFFDGHLMVNGEYWFLINAQTPPGESYGCFLEEIQEDYVVSLRKLSNAHILRELKQRRNQQGVATNTLHRNHEGESSYAQIDETIEGIEVGEEAYLNAQIWIILKGFDRSDLSVRARRIVKNLRDKGAEAFLETDGVDYFFNHLLIGTPPAKLREFPCSSEYAVNLIPFTKDSLHEDGMELHTRNFPVKINLFDSNFTNFNTLITGMSGEGKSFLVGTILYHFHTNTDVNLAIFDLGGSFKRMCNYLGGTSLTTKFNPLRFKDPFFLRDFILSVVTDLNGFPNFKGELLGALKDIHQKDFKFNNFMELITLLNVTFDGLISYFYEIEDFFTNDLNDPPKVFYLDIKGLPEAVIRPFLIYANKLSEATSNKVIKVFDECWAFMHSSPLILKSVVKTGRKENVSSIFITQELNEFSSEYSNVASAILGNTHSKIYFHQDEITHPSIRKVDKDFLKDVKSKKNHYSEFLFSTPNQRKVLRLYPDPFFYELVHTEPDRTRKQEAFIKERLPYMSYQDAFNKWVSYVH